MFIYSHELNANYSIPIGKVIVISNHQRTLERGVMVSR